MKRRFITFCLVLSICVPFAPLNINAQKTPQTPKYKNPALPIDVRVDDLVSRMTLEEKISQMQNNAPAIPRLGIPEYEWWNEALHGVARAGIATVFPQAIGMAATFDEKLVLESADVISTEARAKHHEAVRRNDFGRYKGLTFWSPNINIFRDPRWGRGQETWGEDPFLTGLLGTSFVRGLQGTDPKYLKVVSTVKHFAVHSGPEPERHGFNTTPSERDLRETYLPAFRTTLLDGQAVGVMCAYNAIGGEPACMNTKLMQDILRGEWKFKGHVVSDCGAVQDIWKGHKFYKTEVEAASAAVKHGTDLTCGDEYPSLKEGVAKGMVSEAEITTSVKNLFKIRFRLGMFDPASMVKWARIPFSANDTAPHHAVSLKAARESLVLLKNDGALPLKKNVGTIAVIGPNAADADVLLGNYNGQPSVSVTALDGIRAKVSPQTKVLYSQGMYSPGINFEPISSSALNGGLKAEYFNNSDFSGTPVLARNDATVDFNWGSLAPAKGVNPDGFSIRWTGKVTAPETGKFMLGWRGNGQITVYLDGKAVIDDQQNRRTKNFSADIDFVAGKTYDIRVDYVENKNHYAQSRLVWAPPTAEAKLREDALAKAKQADVVVMVMGITPNVEGEEMPVSLEGFRGGDRTDIALPKPQQKLIEDVRSLGKPVVLVTMGGSALALNNESDSLPAILHAWYPGQFGGTAIADVLFGDYNPAGRLPVTFYKSVADLPSFEDYSMAGRTYRYFTGEPLYPFGYGLSYSKFGYENLRVVKTVKSGAPVTVSATVVNRGKVAGDEVVQLYLTDEAASVPVPVRNLAGVSRIFLKPGEKRVVTFTISARQQSVILGDDRRVIEPGRFSVSVGGEQPGFSGRADAATTEVVTGGFEVTGKLFEIKDK